MTRAEIARQIAYWRTLRFDRRRIVYELKRRLGARWSRRVLAFVDEVLAARGAPPTPPGTAARRAEVIARLERALAVERRGARWVRVERSTDLDALRAAARRLRATLARAGFRFVCVRGDVGQWSDQFKYTRSRGLELYASATLHERRRPYRLALELRFA